MMRRNFKSLVAIYLASIIACFLIYVPSAVTCQIPVFRYALERWSPDLFSVLILYHNPLSAEHLGLVDRLKQAALEVERPANIEVQLFDLNEDPQYSKELLADGYSIDQYPLMVVRYPQWVKTPHLAWVGSLSKETVEALIDSPARQTIVERIGEGESAVWVLIESGNQSKDDAAASRLQENLDLLQQKLQLPSREVIESDEAFQPETQVELRLAFSILRLKRSDPAEAIFASLLINSEPDLHQFNEPIAIPVFGQGRSHFALVGKGINTQTITDSCQFLTGACSCQVKEQNPGSDLVFTANWRQIITGTAIRLQPLPDLMSMATLADSVESKGFSESPVEQQALYLPPTAETPVVENQPLNVGFLIPTAIVVIVSLLGVIGVSFAIKSRRDV